MNVIARLAGIGLDPNGNPEGYLDVFVQYQHEGQTQSIYLTTYVAFLFSDSNSQVQAKGLAALKADVEAFTGVPVPTNAKIRVFGL